MAISNLSSVTTLSASDMVAISSVGLGTDAKVSLGTLLDWIIENSGGGSAAISISGTPSSNAAVGSAYSFVPTTSGGSGTKVFSIASGILPAGLSFDASTGTIAGVPTTVGTSVGLVLAVTDSSGSASLPAFSIAVAADTRPRFGYAVANAAGDSGAFATLFGGMTALTGSSSGGRAGTFSTAASSVNFTWFAVLASAVSGSGPRIFDGTGYGGFAGAASSGIYSGADQDPITTHGTYTDGSSNVWNLYRSNGKAVNFSNFTLS